MNNFIQYLRAELETVKLELEQDEVDVARQDLTEIIARLKKLEL